MSHILPTHMAIPGCATPEGTANFAKNNDSIISKKNYKIFQDLTLSNVGIGTYLGNPDSDTDGQVTDAVKKSIMSGINVIDTAINYRSQKAERSVGKAISEIIQDGKVSRDGLFVCTKNGYVTDDADDNNNNGDFWHYIKTNYTEKGIIQQGDISSSYHCMTVPYLKDQLNRSLNNLGLECIDLIYLHNPVEGQLKDMSKEQFLDKLRDVFTLYEDKRREKVIKYYGLATWECFRVAKDHPLYLSLYDVLDIAKDVGGAEHGLRFIQLPYNMYLDQAFMVNNYELDGKQTSILDVAQSKNIGVFSSVPFMQGRLLDENASPKVDGYTPVTLALQFIRSTPGILAPLVGQKSESHVAENLQVMKMPPLNETEFYDLVKKLTQPN